MTTFIPAVHIVRAVWPTPPFHLRDGMQEGTQALNGADWVIITLNAVIADDRGVEATEGGIYAYPFDRRALEAGFERVFVVRRAFGIEPAAVWRHRAEDAGTG